MEDALHPDNPLPDRSPLQPRLTGPSLAPPFNPNGYFLVAFFCGAFAMSYLALTNLSRLAPISAVRQRTVLVAGVTVSAVIVALVVMPGAWFESQSNIRLILRVLAVIGSGGFYMLHRGPALGRALGQDDGYTSAWKKALPLIGLSILQGVVTYIFMRARGLL